MVGTRPVCGQDATTRWPAWESCPTPAILICLDSKFLSLIPGNKYYYNSLVLILRSLYTITASLTGRLSRAAFRFHQSFRISPVASFKTHAPKPRPKMHILVINDDGPPSTHSSPYVHSLVRELQASGHTVSVCLPHTQRSWIGKAHMIGQTLKPTYYRPPPASSPPAGLGGPEDDLGTTHSRPSADGSVEEWVLVDGTPASCAQIGLHHFFGDRGPVNLVLSGPNYGRNTTAVFALSSGTLGGALEAAACGYKAIALSYAFFTRNHDPEIVGAASRHAVRVVEALARQWPADGSADVYSVNVPLVEGVEQRRTVWAGLLQNYWIKGNSAFEAVDADGADGRDEEEERIREGANGEAARPRVDAVAQPGSGKKGHEHKHFKWAPKLADVMKAVDGAPADCDGRVIRDGHTR